MALTEAERLRQMLGESIPPDGSEEDTLFSEREIEDFIERGEEDLTKAAYWGWDAKWSIYVGLADVQEGTSREALSDLAEHARQRVLHFGKMTGLIPGVSRNVRIGRVVRK